MVHALSKRQISRGILKFTQNYRDSGCFYFASHLTTFGDSNYNDQNMTQTLCTWCFLVQHTIITIVSAWITAWSYCGGSDFYCPALSHALLGLITATLLPEEKSVGVIYIVANTWFESLPRYLGMHGSRGRIWAPIEVLSRHKTCYKLLNTNQCVALMGCATECYQLSIVTPVINLEVNNEA